MAVVNGTDTHIAASSVDAARELVVVLGRLRRRLRDLADAEQLRPSQISVLSRLSKTGPATASGLAAAEKVRPQSMAAILAPLEEQHLIVRRLDPEDGRRQLVSLTEFGRECIADYRQARDEWLVQKLQAGYTEQERAVVLEALMLLERLTES